MAWPVKGSGKTAACMHSSACFASARPGEKGAKQREECGRAGVCLLGPGGPGCLGLGWWDGGHDATKITSPDDPDVMEMQVDG